VRTGAVLKHLARYGEGRLLVAHLDTAGRPLPASLALRAMSRGTIVLEDISGQRRRLDGGLLARWTAQLVSEPFRVKSLLKRIEREVTALEAVIAADRNASRDLNLARSPLYLRTDLSFGVRAGGSVAHIAGVANQLRSWTGPVIVLTTDDIPTLDPGIKVIRVPPREAFWNFSELPTFLLNDAFVDVAADATTKPPAFVYQRYSLNNYAGLHVARKHRVPLVLEYNGSEIWMGRHWGHPLRHEAISNRIELLNLAAADLIVVVSRAMREEILARGIPGQKILVNPNGVDPDRYRPDIDGSPVRTRLGLERFTVIGFIGTFGPWHGAEVLARAFIELRTREAAGIHNVRLLMIGDGAEMARVQAILRAADAEKDTVLTGLVPQKDGPAYLAACDVLVSPHVPNRDGTPFFGSPTKLFEYMAMGKPIVASNLDQIGEVLQHGRSAWMVPPGDAVALADGIQRVLGDPTLARSLGLAARAAVLEGYTWREHTRRIIERLQAAVPA
jgi:glycosyltransferase involved in cell wall biosynthesis